MAFPLLFLCDELCDLDLKRPQPQLQRIGGRQSGVDILVLPIRALLSFSTLTFGVDVPHASWLTATFPVNG